MAGRLYPHATRHRGPLPRPRAPAPTSPRHLAFIAPDPPQWLERPPGTDLDAGDIEAIIGAARAVPARTGVKAERRWTSSMHYARPPLNMHRIRATSRPPASRSLLGAGQAVRHALDRRRRRQHHRAALPARQRPLGRALASPHPRPGQAARRHLADSKTQTPRHQARARSSPTKLS